MVAEWCFCVLVDFAAHKPATLRDDGPAVLEHFAAGDGAQRAARCYVAPERLVRNLSPENGGPLRPPADVFAAGCVAAEILNGGAPTLESGGFFRDCDHVRVSDACWHRATARSEQHPRPALCGAHS